MGILKVVSNAFYILASAMLLYGTLKRRTTPILAYLVLEALSMLIMAILIIFILIGLGEAGSAAADEIAEGKYELDGSDGNLSNEDAAKIAKTATTVAIVVAAIIYGLALSLSIYFWIVVY